MAFFKNGNMVTIEKQIGESRELYIIRGYFVASIYPQIIDNYEEAVKYSKLYTNIKFNKSVYNKTVMDKIINLESHMLCI
jgi:hypothetical protein